MKKYIAIAFLALPLTAISSEVQPLTSEEMYGGVECAIVNKEGKTLLEDYQIKIDGERVSIKKQASQKHPNHGKEIKSKLYLQLPKESY